ncbi:hypothetical protein [Bradyrhizobium elkanii]|uniref:hypothetical protein n=1 Tax=Bradyrhizobium elkanii TaxID=29448 RepID=UPI00114CF686|nr:hypothetical protein [Bradyrhizobium elkanii]
MNMLDDVEFRIAKLQLAEGDILVARLKGTASSVVAVEMKAQLERRLNLPGRVLVIDESVNLQTLSKAEAKKLQLA